MLNATNWKELKKQLKKQLSKAKEELNTIFLQKDDLLAYVIENGFHTADFLRQKAVLSIGERVISGKEDLGSRDVEAATCAMTSSVR